MSNILYNLCRKFNSSLNGVREPDRDYYNDLPGKVPPDIGPPLVPPLPVAAATLPNLKHHHSSQNHASGNSIQSVPAPEQGASGRKQNQQWPGNEHNEILTNRLFRIFIIELFCRDRKLNRFEL